MVKLVKRSFENDGLKPFVCDDPLKLEVAVVEELQLKV